MREKVQKEAKKAWNGKGILNIAPRVGKTRIGVEILKDLGKGKVLICYPNTPIKDSWTEEMEKLGYVNPRIDFTTFLSLKNHLGNNYNLLVLDEIHTLSEAQITFLKDYLQIHPFTEVLGLTGTLSEETEEKLEIELGLEVYYRYTVDEAVNQQVVSDYQIEIHTVKLDNQKLRDYSTKKKKILRTEKQQFDHLSKTIDWMQSSGKNTFFKRLERMRIIQNSLSKLKKTQELLKKGRCLIFCGTTEVADKIGCTVFHSKKNETSEFEKFCSGQGGSLATVKMVNMGVTIKNLDTVIFNYFNSNEEQFIQQLNRCMNYDYQGKIAKIYIICTDEEVEKKWLRKALGSLDRTKISWKI